jgi:arsenite-transporting ATPase
VAQRVYDVPLPDDKYFQAIEDLFERLRGVDQILMDSEITSVRLVTNPEKIVLKETQRAFMYFCLHKMNTDAIVMNRILPDAVKDTYFENWITDQKQYIEEAKSFFSPVPVFTAELFQEEILGYKYLKDFATQIYGRENPLERFFKEAPFSLIKENSDYRLRLRLPFIQKDDVDLNKMFDELIVRIGGIKRHILLPRQVSSLDDVKAKLEGQYLDIIFKGADHDGEKE